MGGCGIHARAAEMSLVIGAWKQEIKKGHVLNSFEYILPDSTEVSTEILVIDMMSLNVCAVVSFAAVSS